MSQNSTLSVYLYFCPSFSESSAARDVGLITPCPLLVRHFVMTHTAGLHNEVFCPFQVVTWRDDARCGYAYLNSMGDPAECDPYSVASCCSDHGWCGNTREHCNCYHCKDFSKLGMTPEKSQPGCGRKRERERERE